MALSLVAYGDSSDSESEEPSIPVKKESGTDIRKLLSVLPPAKSKSGGSKQPVRIGLPKLEKGNDSDSDDDDVPSAKRSKTGSGSSLTALLPQPKGASKMAAGPKNPITTKTMVPYTLSKRYQDSKNRTAKSKAAALRKAKKLNSREGDSDSDDGEEPVSFFSHLDEPHTAGNNTSTFTPDVSNSHSSSWSDSSSFSQPSISALESSNPSTSTYSITPTPQLANSAPLAPKPFRITDPNYDPVSGIYSYGDSSNVPPETQYQGYEESSGINQTGSTSSHPQASGWEQYYHQAEQDQELTPSAEYLEAYQEKQQQQQQGPVKPMPGAGPGLSIDDDVFRRLAGGKKRKNWQESLNDIIDIKEDDVKEEIKIYQKYHSEEAVNKLYKQDPNSKDPTSQQKRKHQLTYLAHQAKANELQLLKHWGQAAATKRQTQMKYGF